MRGCFFEEKYYCGYVGLPPSHPFYEKNDEEFYSQDKYEISVHGGLTFGSGSVGINRTDRLDIPNTWWLGFDTHHFDSDNSSSEYALRETFHLAKQLEEIYIKHHLTKE